jgi:predicted secreted protein
MAVYTGKNLAVLLDSQAFTHVRSASVNHAIDLVEITAAAGTVKQYASTVKDFSGSIEVLHDDSTELFDSEIVPGSTGEIKIRPEGTGSGAVTINGNVIISSVEFGVPYDGVVAVTVGFQGTGDLTVGTQ